MQLNFLDVAIIIIIGTSVIYSTIKGFVKDVFSLTAIILGIIAALLLYPLGSELLEPYISQTQVANIVSFSVIFLAVAVVTSLVGMLISKMIKGVNLSFYDRLFGAVFGFLKGFVLVAVIVIVLSVIMPTALKESKITPYITKAINLVTDILPKDYQDKFDEKKKELEDLGQK